MIYLTHTQAAFTENTELLEGMYPQRVHWFPDTYARTHTKMAYAPHKPEQAIEAKIMSIYGGLREGGAGSVVSLNRGANDGLEVGHVLGLFRNRISQAIDQDTMERVDTPIPEERYALVFVFRVFAKVSYALVLESSRPVTIGDSARNP